jgi:polysaccharide export outer membrane protein
MVLVKRGFFPALLLFVLMMVPAVSGAGEYVIGEGDTLAINVWGVERLNTEVLVRPDGMITVPGLGDVAASGRKPRELQQELTEKLKDLVRNPIVTVTVREITNNKVYIFGSGTKSVVYNLERKTTLLQILCTVTDIRFADLRRAYLLRDGKKVKENFHKLFIDGDIAEDMGIETNDALYIPMLQERSIYVLGAVNTPKAVEYREGVTVMEVILESGGFTKFASQNNTTIVRKDAEGKDEKIPVKAKNLLKDADLSQNIKLKPGDYVIVEESLF